MEEDFLVTIEDYRAVRKGRAGEYCLPGLKRWAEKNGKSYKHILKNGVMVSEMRGINDPYVEKVIEAARGRREKREGVGRGDI